MTNALLFENNKNIEDECLGVGYAVFEIPTMHNLEDYEKIEHIFIDYFVLYHEPSERYYQLSYTELDFGAKINDLGNLEIFVRMKGYQDAGTVEINKKEHGVDECEVTTKFVSESVLDNYGAVREMKDGAVVADLDLKELIIGNKEIKFDVSIHNSY